MSFDPDFITTTTLIRVELPQNTLRICDGGFCIWASEPQEDGSVAAQTYESEHEDYGTLYAGNSMSDGEGDESPAAVITFLSNSNASAQALTDPAMQWSPFSMWQASINGETGFVITAIPLFFGFVDIPTLRDGAAGRLIDMEIVSDTERMFLANEGNRLSQESHQRRHPGERGLDNMTGVENTVAWGAEDKPTSKGGSSTFDTLLALGGVAASLFGNG